MRRAWLVLVVVSLASFQTAMALSIIFVFTGLLSALSGRWADRWGPARFVVAGSLMWTGGMVWQWVTLGGEEDLVAWVLGATLADGQIGNLGTSYIMLAAGGAVTAVLGVRCTQPKGMPALVLK